MTEFLQLVAKYHKGDNLVNYGAKMYECICGFKTSYKSSMESHLRTCSAAKNKMSSSSASNYDDSLLTSAAISTSMDRCCSYDSSSSYSSSSSDYSGGGSFDGGGSSGDW